MWAAHEARPVGAQQPGKCTPVYARPMQADEVLSNCVTSMRIQLLRRQTLGPWFEGLLMLVWVPVTNWRQICKHEHENMNSCSHTVSEAMA